MALNFVMKVLYTVLFSALFTVITNQGFSQSDTTKTKKTTTKKQPAPPPKKLPDQDTKIDVISVDSAVSSYKEPVLDTIPPPQDDLTKELKKMLETTGALNLGVQFAKGLQELQASGQDILPREFYERLYDEIANGNGRRWFENAIIKIYRQHLTVEDVKELNAFYSTPAGKKYISLLPVLLEESKEVGTSIGRYLGMKIYEQLLNEGKLK